MLGEGRAGGLDVAAGLLTLEPERDLGLEPLGLGVEEPEPALQVEDAGLGVLEAAVRQGDPRQADLRRDEIGVERQRLADTGPRPPGGRRPRDRGPRRRSARRETASSRSSQALIAASGCTPTKPSTAWPSRTANTAGIDRTPKSAASPGSRSVSTLARTNRPPYSAASRSSTGPSIRHGPHHSAQKSITTGTSDDRSITSRWKFSDVASMTHGDDVG